MPIEETKDLFTDKFIDNIRRAIERNQRESKDTDIYHHPTEARIVKKSVDLTLKKPLGLFGDRQPKSFSQERWLEAYLIHKAKRNNWILELAGKQYKFLASQLKFRREVEAQGKTHRLLDILLYDEHDSELVILELKRVRQLKKAKGELDYYKKKVRESVDGLRRAFDLPEIRGISGYMVWPASSREGKWAQDLDKHLGNYGLVEYMSPHGIVKKGKLEEPWERFRELGEHLIINFVCRKPRNK